MTLKCLYRYVLAALLIALPASGNPWGAWSKTLPLMLDLPAPAPSPSFVIVKTGVFDSKGRIKLSLSERERAVSCSLTLLESQAWISHRLSSDEALDRKAGIRLGQELATSLKRHCQRSVELDIEPMPSPPGWLSDFLKGVRSSMAGFKLRLAIPPISATPLPGFSWKTEEALKVLEVSDGLDVMVYDTGLKDARSYEKLISEQLAFADSSLRRFPEKSIYLGFPSYADKTKLHKLDVENPRMVLNALVRLDADKADIVCRWRIPFSFYAAWTVAALDAEAIKRISDWRNERCRDRK